MIAPYILFVLPQGLFRLSLGKTWLESPTDIGLRTMGSSLNTVRLAVRAEFVEGHSPCDSLRPRRAQSILRRMLMLFGAIWIAPYIFVFAAARLVPFVSWQGMAGKPRGHRPAPECCFADRCRYAASRSTASEKFVMLTSPSGNFATICKSPPMARIYSQSRSTCVAFNLWRGGSSASLVAQGQPLAAFVFMPRFAPPNLRPSVHGKDRFFARTQSGFFCVEKRDCFVASLAMTRVSPTAKSKRALTREA